MLLDGRKVGAAAQSLADELRAMVVGQDEAIDAIVNHYQAWFTGMVAPNRPAGNFLFLGPTGTGKTRVVEATAASLLKNSRALIKIDCGEFQHSHEIAKLTGSPPGYLGHRETHPILSQEAVNQYHTDKCKLSFVLFDEIEKASDALWHLLLGMLDKATLTLGDNRKVDFSAAFIFMTSNVGAVEMSSILNPKMGFLTPQRAAMEDGAIDHRTSRKINKSGVEAARRKFPPEFVNRADKIVVFRPLGHDELRRILDIELGIVQQRILQAANAGPFVFRATDAAKDLLLREGTDVKYGARPLKRAIDRMLVYPLSNLIATRQVETADVIEVDTTGTELVFKRIASSAAGAVA